MGSTHVSKHFYISHYGLARGLHTYMYETTKVELRNVDCLKVDTSFIRTVCSSLPLCIDKHP